MAKAKVKLSILTQGEATKRAKDYLEKTTSKKIPRWYLTEPGLMLQKFDEYLPFLDGNLKLKVLAAMIELKAEIKKRIISEL